MSTKKFKEALKVVWGYGEEKAWPYNKINLSKTLLNRYHKEFCSSIEEALNSKFTKVGPSCVFRTFDVIVKAMMHFRKVENRKLVENMLSFIYCLKSGDIFNETGSNLIFQSNYINECIKTVRKYETNIVHKIIALLKAYTELIYFRCYDISQEIHGPYLTNKINKPILIAWTYRNLRPSHLCLDQYILPYKEISFENLYNKNISIRLDIYNHFYQEGDNLKKNLLSCNILIDNKAAQIDDLKDLEQILVEKLKLLFMKIDCMSNDDLTIHYLKNLWYKLYLISGNYKYLITPLLPNNESNLISINSENPDYRILDLFF